MVDRLRHLLRRHGGNRRSLWLLLATLLSSWNAYVLWLADFYPSFQVLNLFLWFGCVIALEDRLPELWPRPSRASAACGALLVLLLLWRGSWILNQQDRFGYLILPGAVLALALLNRPWRQLGLFAQPLLIALLMPVLSRLVVFSDLLSSITAVLTWVLLTALGTAPVIQGVDIALGSGAVTVSGACSGVDQLAISLAVAIIFLMVFPLQRWTHRLLALLVAVLAAVAVNMVRITLLALLVMLPDQSGKAAFDFFHESMGSLIFSLAAVWIFGWFYTLLVDREIAQRQRLSEEVV